MQTFEITTYPENCTGCLMCQMRCSFAFTGRFNPAQARVLIQRPVTGGRGISFTDECTDCGLCARVCVYGAIRLQTIGG